MLNKCAVYLTDMLIRSKAIAAEDQEIYVYGWEMILSTAGAVLGVLILAIIFRQVPGTLLFLLFSLTLRGYAGGYHANSYLGCFFTTLGVYVLALMINLFTPGSYLPVAIAALFLLSVFIIFIRAPQEHPNRPISDMERIKFIRTSRVIVIAQGLIAALLYSWQPALAPFIWWGILGTAAASASLLVPNHHVS